MQRRRGAAAHRSDGQHLLCCHAAAHVDAVVVLGRAAEPRASLRARALAAHGNRTLVRVRQPPKALGAPNCGEEGGLQRQGRGEGGELQQHAKLLRERGAAPSETEQRLEGAGAQLVHRHLHRGRVPRQRGRAAARRAARRAGGIAGSHGHTCSAGIRDSICGRSLAARHGHELRALRDKAHQSGLRVEGEEDGRASEQARYAAHALVGDVGPRAAQQAAQRGAHRPQQRLAGCRQLRRSPHRLRAYGLAQRAELCAVERRTEEALRGPLLQDLLQRVGGAWVARAMHCTTRCSSRCRARRSARWAARCGVQGGVHGGVHGGLPPALRQAPRRCSRRQAHPRPPSRGQPPARSRPASAPPRPPPPRPGPAPPQPTAPQPTSPRPTSPRPRRR